jgi:hypothetical protein
MSSINSILSRYWVYIVLIILLVCCLRTFSSRGRRHPQYYPLTGNLVSRPTPANPDLKSLLDAKLPHDKIPRILRASSIRYPSSTIMPDMNIIDGVAPYNPDVTGKEWADTPRLGTSPAGGRTATSTSLAEAEQAGAVFVPTVQKTPAPNLVPVPTMLAAPTTVKVAPLETFTDSKDPYNGYTNQPLLVSQNLWKSVDGEMSKWSQFGPCSSDGTQQRTRTCIHDAINGGTPCSETLQTRKCIY